MYEPMASDYACPDCRRRRFPALHVCEHLFHGGAAKNFVSAKGPATGNRVTAASLGDDMPQSMGHELPVLPATDYQYTPSHPWALDSWTNCGYVFGLRPGHRTRDGLLRSRRMWPLGHGDRSDKSSTAGQSSGAPLH